MMIGRPAHFGCLMKYPSLRHILTHRHVISCQVQNEQIVKQMQLCRNFAIVHAQQQNCEKRNQFQCRTKCDKFLSNCFQFKRLYSEQDSENNGQNRVLPRRLLKRLQKQNITESEFLTKVGVNDMNVDSGNKLTEPEQLSIDSKEELQKLLDSSKVEQKIDINSDLFPSDMEKFQQWEKSGRKSSGKPKICPTKTSVILFPGQGSQFVGMGEKLLPFPGVQDMFDEASSILGYDLLDLCLKGPKEKLDQTIYCQPAVLVSSLAGIERLKEEHPEALENCVATAGFSVGEFSALVLSGVLSFPDAVKLVKVRAEAMQQAAEAVSSGMLTVIVNRRSELKEAMKMSKEYCVKRHQINEPICKVANFLFPGCKVLAGHSEALEFIQTNAKEFHLMRARRIAVSGAFHTKLMNPAKKPFQSAFRDVNLGTPKIMTFSNVTGDPYHPKTDYEKVLGEQMVRPVRWEQIIHNIYKRPQGEEFPYTYEVGPGKQMATLLKHINQKAFLQCHNIDA